jgi:hypothetical protein
VLLRLSVKKTGIFINEKGIITTAGSNNIRSDSIVKKIQFVKINHALK